MIVPRPLLRAVPAGLALALLMGEAVPIRAAAATAGRNREERRSAVVRAVERASPAVVNISTFRVRKSVNPFSRFNNPLADELFREFFGGAPPRARRRTSLGSGVIIRPDGYILTNEHVISRASEIRVSLAGKRIFPARLIGAAPANDLAVIKIDSTGPLPYLPMGRSDDLMIGETVIAIGNPFGLAHTVTTGVVSAVGRSLSDRQSAADRRPSDFIQTDASINPGNSGGPLLNQLGELIGINTAIFSNAQGIGFAIPIDRAHRIVQDLILFGKVRKGWIGFVLQDLRPRIARYLNYPRGKGAVVTQVMKDSPAERAGIRREDILLAFGGKEVRSRDDYLNELAGYTVGSKVAVRLWRGGNVLRRVIEVGEIPAALADEIARSWLGVSVEAIDERNLRAYRLATKKGVVVTRSFDGGPSRAIGIRPGDVIRQINGVDTDDLDTFRQALVRAHDFPRVQLIVQRRREGYNVTLEP